MASSHALATDNIVSFLALANASLAAVAVHNAAFVAIRKRARP